MYDVRKRSDVKFWCVVFGLLWKCGKWIFMYSKKMIIKLFN